MQQAEGFANDDVGGLRGYATRSHLVAAQLEGDSDVDGLVDDADRLQRFDAGLRVSADGRRKDDAGSATHASEIVDIHRYRILCYALPYAGVAGLFPIEIGSACLRAGSISMHDVAPLFVPSCNVRQYFAEGVGIKPFVEVSNGAVNLVLGGGHPSDIVLQRIAHVL